MKAIAHTNSTNFIRKQSSRSHDTASDVSLAVLVLMPVIDDNNDDNINDRWGD